MIEPFTDIYFQRSKYILEKEGLNPFVRAQVFLRKRPGKIFGVREALTIIETSIDLKIFALSDGDKYRSMETVLLLEGRAQDIIPLETVLLGIISAATTKANDHCDISLRDITRRTRNLVNILSGRPLYYFGARHWHYRNDAEISKAVFRGGAAAASTQVGAAVARQKPVGTIPHSLECVFAWKFGPDQAVVSSTRAFDKWIDKRIPRVALVDFRNKEIDDSLACAEAIKNLWGVRVDTAGENIMQGTKFSRGVSVSGITALRKELNKAGFSQIKIVLSSGFGNKQKLEAFVHAEKKLKMKLFDAVGVGELFSVRAATMDIVGVGANLNSLKPIAKVGREYKPNERLKKMR
ncbi:hypothetical protein A3A79_03550 [Candidatus Gottesmanbacteria bacterium RIFCSPLOWO2_01_FULL_43_11b]|uniref:Quinolinate phosphoribosyl transferase N-terminal domain-containing protein n=1 Tax=Candidatus Gottesmanbacteria bacterium RIFCSPLOWO2_01_FULL_43_11b TaxID=1798392 RepID=A0A1F6AHZ8_9BACT|nr:MAG: hypothetical protein A3A79_03550 [Candidatus Gottesmanbacteria bacterium RIFCSPLOWO2_01_FULL_43_11b]